ncbi:MAG: FMN-binding protein [Oscillospiraceae bacterium]
MNKSNSVWNDILKPVVVLTVICIVVSAALAATNSVTLPIITANAAKAADAARIELLPEATEGFEKVDVEMENIVEMYKAKNDVGYVITSTAGGYGGPIKFMVAYDKDGKIVNLKVLECTETPGLGMKITERAFLDQFIGKDKELAKADVDMITGVTISSSATLDGLNTALKAFNEKAKGIVVVELTFEEKLNEYFGNMVATTEFTNENALEFYNSDKGVVVVTEGKGNGIIGDEHLSGKTLKTYVSFDKEGKITGVMFDDSSETKGLGTVISEPDFIGKIVGKAAIDDVDVISGTTYSSKGAIEAVNKAIAAYGAIK